MNLEKVREEKKRKANDNNLSSVCYRCCRFSLSASVIR